MHIAKMDEKIQEDVVNASHNDGKIRCLAVPTGQGRHMRQNKPLIFITSASDILAD